VYLIVIQKAHELAGSPLFTVALFPWDIDSLGTLWSGGLSSPDFLPAWRGMIDTWSGSIATGGASVLRVRSVFKSTASITVKLPHVSGLLPSGPAVLTDLNRIPEKSEALGGR
jgi:hypothetical protein